MSAELKVIGYLNRFERDALPIAATPVFQFGDRRYVRERSSKRDIDMNEMIELEDGGWITWVNASVVNSDEGRFLLHEDLSDLLHDNHPAGLVQSYLLPSEEHTRRTELATAYLSKALRTLCMIESGDIQDADNNMPIEYAMNELEHIARARPEMMAVRVLKAAIADNFDNSAQMNAEMAQIKFEFSRCGISEWIVDMDNNPDSGRGWHTFEISENSLKVIPTASKNFPGREGYESTVTVDPFSLLWFREIEKLVCTLKWLAVYGNLLKTVSLFQLLILHVRKQKQEELSTEKLKRFLVSMPMKSSPLLINLGRESPTLNFSIWGSTSTDDKLVALENALAGRIIGMLTLNAKQNGNIDLVADTLSNNILKMPVSVRIRNVKALLEIENERSGGGKLYRELFYRSCVMKAYEELKLTKREEEEGRLLVARADYQYLANAYGDPQYSHYEHHNIGNAIDSVWYTQCRIGQLHFRLNEYDAAENLFEQACQYLQFRMGHQDDAPIIRLLDSYAYSTYMLALLQSDRVLAAKAVELYNKLMIFTALGYWQEKCLRNAQALKQGSGLSDDEVQEFIRSVLANAVTVYPSSNHEMLRARVWKLYGMSIRKQNNETDSIGGLEHFDDLFMKLTEWHQNEPSNDEVAIMRLKACIATFKFSLSKFELLSDSYETSSYALSYQFTKERAASLDMVLQDFMLPGQNTQDFRRTNDIRKTKEHAIELLAKYFFSYCRDYETAKRYNDYLIASDPNDLIATMRKHFILAEMASTQQDVIDTAKSLEKSAAEYREKGDADEAARRFFQAGAIYSSAAIRFSNDNNLRQGAIGLYREAVATKRPPHLAAVYRLAENLYLVGETSESINYISRIDETDWRAAVLYGRIVCSTFDSTNISVAENRLTIALQHLLQQRPPHLRAQVRKLVDVGCSLSVLRGPFPQDVEHQWMKVIRETYNDEAIFGACLNVLLNQQIFAQDLAEIAKKTFRNSRIDKHMREIRDYYLGYIFRKGSPSLDIGAAGTLKPAEVIAIVPDIGRIIDTSGRSEVRDLFQRNELWSPDLDIWLSDIQKDLETNTKMLKLAEKVKPKLVSIDQLMGSFKSDKKLKAEESVWVDAGVLRDLCQILSPSTEPNLQLDSNGISLSFPKSEGFLTVDSDSIIKYSTNRLGGNYLPTNREIRLPF